MARYCKCGGRYVPQPDIPGYLFARFKCDKCGRRTKQRTRKPVNK